MGVHLLGRTAPCMVWSRVSSCHLQQIYRTHAVSAVAVHGSVSAIDTPQVVDLYTVWLTMVDVGSLDVGAA